MEHERLAIEIDGEERTDLYADLIRLEVELDDGLAAMFRFTLSLVFESNGGWRHLDDEGLRVWKPVTIHGGFESGMEELIRGYITQVRPNFGSDPTEATLEIWGIDGSVLMDREEKLKAWPDKKDSDIAEEVLRSYGFTPEVEETGVIHDATISTTIQRETDMAFLKRLALRNGFDCYIEGEMAYFRPPPLDEPPQPVLAVNFGEETTVSQLALDVDALAPTNVTMAQLDRLTKEVLASTVATSEQSALGATTADGLPTGDVTPGQLVIGMNVVTGLAEMEALAQGLYDKAAWFVTGEGEVIANRYGHILRPRRTVTIKGIGETYSGLYYVNHVTHRFTPDGYTQSFQVRRNGLGLTGDEAFAGGGGLLGGLL